MKATNEQIQQMADVFYGIYFSERENAKNDALSYMFNVENVFCQMVALQVYAQVMYKAEKEGKEFSTIVTF